MSDREEDEDVDQPDAPEGSLSEKEIIETRKKKLPNSVPC